MKVEKLNREAICTRAGVPSLLGHAGAVDASLTCHEDKSFGGRSSFKQNVGLIARRKFQNQ